MSAFRSIVFSAALAGLIVGVFVTAVQQVGTVPLILWAEVYERQAATAERSRDAAKSETLAAHEHEAAAWEPADGFERNAYTALFNVLEWVGFGLLLNGAVALLRRSINWREGFLWGLGAFVAFVIAPGLGLPPELPGIAAAPLLDRQFWWVATVIATAAGLSIIALRHSPAAALVGILLIAAPHLVGAPRLDHVETNIPEALSQQFIVWVTLTALVSWALLGGLTGHFYRKFSDAA
jgi:cobalt transporter subunit CbtA